MWEWMVCVLVLWWTGDLPKCVFRIPATLLSCKDNGWWRDGCILEIHTVQRPHYTTSTNNKLKQKSCMRGYQAVWYMMGFFFLNIRAEMGNQLPQLIRRACTINNTFDFGAPLQWRGSDAILPPLWNPLQAAHPNHRPHFHTHFTPCCSRRYLWASRTQTWHCSARIIHCFSFCSELFLFSHVREMVNKRA